MLTDTFPQVKYYDRWNQVWKDANSQAMRWDPTGCHSCSKMIKPFLLNLGGGIASLTDLNDVIGAGGCCKDLRGRFTSWRKSVETSIAEIGSFGKFL
jgi:hypothetical protein